MKYFFIMHCYHTQAGRAAVHAIGLFIKKKIALLYEIKIRTIFKQLLISFIIAGRKAFNSTILPLNDNISGKIYVSIL